MSTTDTILTTVTATTTAPGIVTTLPGITTTVANLTVPAATSTLILTTTVNNNVSTIQPPPVPASTPASTIALGALFGASMLALLGLGVYTFVVRRRSSAGGSAAIPSHMPMRSAAPMEQRALLAPSSIRDSSHFMAETQALNGLVYQCTKRVAKGQPGVSASTLAHSINSALSSAAFQRFSFVEGGERNTLQTIYGQMQSPASNAWRAATATAYSKQDPESRNLSSRIENTIRQALTTALGPNFSLAKAQADIHSIAQQAAKLSSQLDMEATDYIVLFAAKGSSINTSWMTGGKGDVVSGTAALGLAEGSRVLLKAEIVEA